MPTVVAGPSCGVGTGVIDSLFILFIERSFVFEISINDGKWWFRNWEFGFGRISNRININCSSGDLKNRSQHTLSNKNINIQEVQEVWIRVRVVVCFSMWPWYKLAMGWLQGVSLSSLEDCWDGFKDLPPPWLQEKLVVENKIKQRRLFRPKVFFFFFFWFKLQF